MDSWSPTIPNSSRAVQLTTRKSPEYYRLWNLVNEEIDGDADEEYVDVLDQAFVDIENTQFMNGQNIQDADADEPVK